MNWLDKIDRLLFKYAPIAGAVLVLAAIAVGLLIQWLLFGIQIK